MTGQESSWPGALCFNAILW